MKAEKSHDLPLAGCKLGKARSVVLRTRKANDVTFSRGQMTNVPAHQSGRETEFVLTLLFCSIQAVSGLDDAQFH